METPQLQGLPYYLIFLSMDAYNRFGNTIMEGRKLKKVVKAWESGDLTSNDIDMMIYRRGDDIVPLLEKCAGREYLFLDAEQYVYFQKEIYGQNPL